MHVLVHVQCMYICNAHTLDYFLRNAKPIRSIENENRFLELPGPSPYAFIDCCINFRPSFCLGQNARAHCVLYIQTQVHKANIETWVTIHKKINFCSLLLHSITGRTFIHLLIHHVRVVWIIDHFISRILLWNRFWNISLLLIGTFTFEYKRLFVFC